MRVPKKILFGSKTIKVKFINKKLADKKNIYGEYNHKTKTIVLDRTLDHSETIDTTLHEVFHALLDFYYVDLKAKDEEIACSVLASGLCNILYQNQDLLDFLYKSLKKE
jgi:hypothetical protein